MMYPPCLQLSRPRFFKHSKKITLIFLWLFGWHCTSFAQTLAGFDIQLVLDINWDSTPSQNEINLQMHSASDTWITRITLSNPALPLAQSCNGNLCNSSVFASAQNNKNVRVRIQSTTEANFNQQAFRHDGLRSLDEFEYFSDGDVNNPDYLAMNDLINGLYVGPNATQLESWILERDILATNFEGSIEANPQAFISFLELDNPIIEVQEYFLNALQQISYLKHGTATVASVLIITEQNNPYPLECAYEIVSDWGSGFQSLVSLKNVSNSAVNGWLSTLDFADAVYVDNYWNVTMSGYIPHSVARPTSWNTTIYPGQEVNFGFVGSKAASQVADALIDGKLCR